MLEVPLLTPSNNPGLKFDCLDGKTVVQAEISDHNPIIYTCPLGYNFCSFNILMQCAEGNNGFGRIEDVRQYQTRLLGPIMHILGELVTIYKVDVFLLQEAPPLEVGKHFYSGLRNLLPYYQVNTEMYKELDWKDQNDISASGGVFTIYTDNLIATEITDTIKPEVCPANKNRFQAFKFNYTHTRSFCAANFHGKFTDQTGMENDIKCLIDQDFLVGGDFNLLKNLIFMFQQKRRLQYRAYFSNKLTMQYMTAEKLAYVID